MHTTSNTNTPVKSISPLCWNSAIPWLWAPIYHWGIHPTNIPYTKSLEILCEPSTPHQVHLICLRAQIKAEVRQERKSSSRIVLFREKAMTPFLEDQSHQESGVPRGFESWATRARGIFSCCFISLFCDSRGWVLGLQPYQPQSYIPSSSPCCIWFYFFVCLFVCLLVFFCFLRQDLK